MIRIKICGIRREEDALVAASLGVDALGFIFYPKSKRYIRPDEAGRLIRRIPPLIGTVGLFVDASLDEIEQARVASGVGVCQLHGDESPEFCDRVKGAVIKAFRVSDSFDFKEIGKYRGISAFLLDAWDPQLHGGTGRTVDWTKAATATRYGNMILAGGLNPGNILEAIETVAPYGVDLNSGVEVRPGEKNRLKIKEAVDLVRSEGSRKRL